MFVQRSVEVERPAMQGSLLTMGEPACPSTVGPLTRIELGNGSWIDHRTGWLPGADAWFDDLHDTLEWKHATRPMYENIVEVPRLIWSRPSDHELALQAVGGADSPMSHRATGVMERLDRLADQFGEHYGRPLRRIQANLYRDGDDSVTWHRDSVTNRFDSLVAIVSMGAERTFAFRPFGGGETQRVSLGWGDLLVMGGTTQQHWEHAVPKAATAAPRISVMFRG